MVGDGSARSRSDQLCEFPIKVLGNDLAAKEYDKFEATVRWARERGYGPEDIVFVGDDFNDGGSDSHVRIGGLDRIVITDYRNFADAVGVLLKKWK